MWIATPSHAHARMVWITWRPPQQHLHYTDLYAGVWEYLREAPVSGREREAREYLAALLNNAALLNDAALINNALIPYDTFPGRLQRDRITWVRAWLAELPKMQNIG